MLLALWLACPAEFPSANEAPLAPPPGGAHSPAAGVGEGAVTSATVVRVAGSDASRALTDPAAKSLSLQGITVTALDAAGGGDAIKSLRAGEADIAFLGRALRGSETDLVATTVGYDAAVVIVSNAIRNLGPDDVAGLFSGNLANWKLVGGDDLPVHLYVGPPERGATRLLNDHFKLEGALPTNARVKDPERELLAAVAEDPKGVGVVSLRVLGAEGAPPVSRVNIDGIGPNIPEIREHYYPLILPLTVVTVGQPAGAARTFVDYLLGVEGQALVAKGWVPVK